MDDDLGDSIYQLPVSGHYDCGYSYGAGKELKPAPPPKHPAGQLKPADPSPQWSFNSTSDSPRDAADLPRPASPPIILPHSFTVSKPDTEIGGILPHSTTVSRPDTEASSSLSSLSPSRRGSMISTDHIQTSTPSPATSRSSSTRKSTSRLNEYLAPDPLPSHSNPQQLTPSQSAAFAGPAPIEPLRLQRRKVVNVFTSDTVYTISEETRLKLSGQSIHQIHEPGSGSTKSIGTLAFAADSASSTVAAILHGQDVHLQRESPTANRWLFRPSRGALTPAQQVKKGAPSWYWLRDKVRCSLVLVDAKKNGAVVARLQRDILSFEKPGLTAQAVGEISFAALAFAEMARRQCQIEGISVPSGQLTAEIARVAMGETLERLAAEEDLDRLAKLRRRVTLTLR